MGPRSRYIDPIYYIKVALKLIDLFQMTENQVFTKSCKMQNFVKYSLTTYQ